VYHSQPTIFVIRRIASDDHGKPCAAVLELAGFAFSEDAAPTFRASYSQGPSPARSRRYYSSAVSYLISRFVFAIGCYLALVISINASFWEL